MKKLVLAFFIISSIPGFAQIPTTGLMAYYPFNNNTNDDSGNGKNGSPMGAPSYSTDRFGVASSALQLNGSNQYILLPSSIYIPSSLSISFWIKTSSSSQGSWPGGILLFDRDCNDMHDWGISLGLGRKIQFLTEYSYIDYVLTSSSQLNTDWNHIVVVRDAIIGVKKIYINGTLNAQSSYNNQPFLNNSYNISVGKVICEGGNPYNGKIDDIRIYNRPLNEYEILTLYNSTSEIIYDPYNYGYQTNLGYSNDPVNTATGNLTHDETDLSIASRGISLSFQRHYNSSDTLSGPLGKGWTHSYNIVLTENTAQQTVSIRWDDGRMDYWHMTASDTYVPSYLGCYDHLIKNADNTWKIVKKNLDVYNFGSTGKLLSIADKNGNTIFLTYSNSTFPNLVTSLTDPIGRVITLIYSSSGHLTQISDFSQPPRTVNYSFSSNKLSQVTDVFGNTVDYTYTAEDFLYSITDQRGITTVVNVYDSHGRVMGQQDGRGTWTNFSYNTPEPYQTTITKVVSNIHAHNGIYKMLQSIINPLNDTVLYGYDTGNNRNSITDRNGKMTKYVYDTLGNVLSTIEPGPDGDTTFTEYNNQTFRDLPTKMIDAAGIETDWTYDNYGNVVSELKNNVTKSWTYNTFGQVITETNGCGNVTQYVYSADGLLLQTISPEGNSKWYGYDSLWRKTSETDGRGSTSGDPYYTTTFIYDNADRLVQTIGPAPDSITRTYTYDQVGNKISETDGNGNMTDYSYDNNNNLLTVTDSTGTTTYVYDQLDRKISMTDANNHTTSYTYDNADRLVSLTDSEGNIWMYIYDKQGNMLSETDPSGITMTYEYNSLNKQILAKDELENTRKSTYDPLGRLTSYINANNDTITYSYDAFGRLITVNEPGGGITQYSYDNCGNLLQIMDASTHQVNTREYDQDNRLTKNYDGIGNFYQYSYNENGNISSMTDAKGQTTYYEYDAYNRISQVDYPDGLIISYTYDNNGNVLIMTDTPGSNTFTYDSRNRLLSSTDRYGKQVHYQYDAVGNRTALIYPDNKQVNYTYDDASRLTAVTDWNGNITHYHYSGSRVDSITFPNNLTEIREYDIAGRLTEMTTGDTLLSLLWQRDGEGNPVSAAEKGTLLPEVPSNDIYYDYDSDNRLNNSSEGNYTYDNDGNLIMRRLIDDTTAFSYNSQNLLIAQQKGNHIIQHVYDGNGNRIARIENGVERRYVLDLGSPMSNVLCETDNTGNISAYYIYGTQLIAKVDSIGTRHYYHTNNLSTVLALSNESGTITDRYAYGPFGDLYMQEGITANPFKYVGGLGVMFEDNRLYFMRARFYDPETGRFLSKDPVEGSLNTPVGLNKYVYGLNDPLFFIDPKGEVAPLVALGLAAIAGGTVNLGSYLFFDVYLEKKDFKWEAAGAKFVGGAAGTLTAILSAPFVSPIASMAAGGAVSEAIGSIGSTNDPGEVAANTIYGAFAGGLIGKILPSSAIGFKMNNGGILQTFSKNSGRFVSISEILSAELIGEMTTNTISKLIYPSIRTSGTNVPLIWQNNVIWNALSVKSYHYSL